MSSFTTYGWLLSVWILIIPFQYGYHISVLNQLHSVLTCKQPALLPTCIPMSDFSFSAVTAVFTLGGLLGSLTSNLIMDRYGRKSAARASALFVAAGTALMAFSGGVPALGIGRFLVGIGSGIGLCVSPIYLAEITPSKISGTVGVFTQMAIVLGIFLTQLIGLNFATPTTWRYVLFLSFALSLAHFFLSAPMVDTPSWLASRSKPHAKEDAAAAERKIWGSSFLNGASPHIENDSRPSSIHDPLLAEPDDESLIHAQDSPLPLHENVINLPTLLLHTPRDVRRPMIIVCCAMIAQQVSGINAVLYYSNEILSHSLPELAPYVSLGITVVNVIMTFPPIILIEKLGRTRLLTLSTVGALTSLIVVGVSLDMQWVGLASAGIVTFVMSFAIGLGPIPFVMIPEVSPFYAVSALSSLALSLNWIANFLVGLVFLPLRNLLSGGDADKEGRVFWVFAILLAFFMAIVRVSYRG